jgi:hypothetical protein
VLARTVPAGHPRVKASGFWYNGRVAAPPRLPPLRLSARPGRLVAVDGAGFVLGAALLAALRLVPQLLSPLAFWLLLVALATAFAVDFLRWHLRGVRSVNLEGDLLTLQSGRLPAVRRIERTAVREVRSRRRWGGHALTIMLRTGKRLLLRDDAFDPAGFLALTDRLRTWTARKE